MSESQPEYIVARGSLYTPNGMIERGSFVPQGYLDAEQAQSLLDDGRIEVAEAYSPEPVSPGQAPQEPHRVGKWLHARTNLEGKSLEDLLLMVIAADPDYDTDSLGDEEACIDLLCSEYDERVGGVLAQASDTTTPGGGQPGSSSSLEDARGQARVEGAKGAQ